MQATDLVLKDLVLVGGGHGHVHTLKMFGMKPIPGVRVTLITRDIMTPYSGMLPGYVAGYYTKDECHIDLGKLCAFSSVTVIHTEATGLDPSKKLIHCKDGRPPIRYDVLSIDIGITPKALPSSLMLPTITPVKPITGFSARWELILQRIREHPENQPLNIAVVGGGGGGVELCFAMQYRLKSEMIRYGKDPSFLRMSIFNRGPSLMSSHSVAVQQKIHEILVEKGITVVPNAEIVKATTEVQPASHIATDPLQVNNRIPQRQESVQREPNGHHSGVANIDEVHVDVPSTESSRGLNPNPNPNPPSERPQSIGEELIGMLGTIGGFVSSSTLLTAGDTESGAETQETGMLTRSSSGTISTQPTSPFSVNRDDATNSPAIFTAAPHPDVTIDGSENNTATCADPSAEAAKSIMYLVSKDGRKFEFDEAIWCTQADGQSWLAASGIACTPDGFLCVGPTLESINTRCD